MTTTITEYLAEQKRLAEAAAPGKWEKRGIGYIFSEGTSPLSKEFGYDGTPIFDSFTWPEYGEANADFVIAARESVPRLVAALEAVVALNTGDNRRLYGNDFEAGMAKALWMVHSAIEATLGGETECGDYPAPCNHDPAHERKD